ncbi:competence/damage-inducible protein A [Sporanaerobacter acetigenes]|uniref:competence/damage-inducible protein A n=1 Tax=Sporanaerobacter acetigenes TaxID=165813 RepID=UPI001044AD3F|nr:competence/damage-inducible protein A [Sporanaerobacter acetigenes]
MKAEIICVGTELLLGNIVNTNAQFLSQRLADLGIDVYYHSVVGDNAERLEKATKIALNRSELIIYTGGLGPTSDDLTKEIVSNILGLEMKLDNISLEKIKEYFKKSNKIMTENNIKQAILPKDCIVLKNDVGTAPGVFLDYNEKKIVLLPGPPKEMNLMFNNYVVPLIKQDYIIKSKTLKTIGIGESQLEDLIKDLIEEQTNPTIATYAKEGQVDIRITGKDRDEETIDESIKKLVEKIDKVLKNYIYSYNNKTIEEVFYNLLKEKNMKVAFCESCTGGLVSSRFTRIPGASLVFDRCIVTYSNNAKITELSVKGETLNRYSAVSSQTAIEMANGLLSKSNVDMALSTTGIAGPSGGTKTTPVGTVFIGIATKHESLAIECHFSGDRQSIQDKAASKVFDEGRKYLLKINH